MRKAVVYTHGKRAGVLTEVSPREYRFTNDDDYNGQAISLTMPVGQKKFSFDGFPPFFEGLLPEGIMLEGLLRISKIDHKDYFSQLMATGADLVGAVTVEPMEDE
ncbi:HipA N-terminal domain-containing protein [Flagellimonas halotolerans]|uniref:HipA N-terminal domain-containing protein n=1 Tax=Flagellimonas halotolerans TaxID=3112164 RepID=A0ABU6IRE7_9FLAO|nr:MULTISPECIES: HipA N-terminal domain-containing protein [unclassified Allomuricauda]MEC3965724.1 HipA N-terminal domain-containing protein [Muricauda sp. SYSU M86414]MEC4265591.1 HipA N-terminal domain-containing protein [Muricauda sp. SYSU M84420]